MAPKYKRAGAGDWDTNTEWSTTSGGGADTTFPTAGDVAILDDNSGDCTLDATAACDTLTIGTVGALYTGTLDAGSDDVNIGGLDCTYGASATLDLGSGQWVCTNGNFDYGDIGTFDDGSSTVVMEGTCGLLYLNPSNLYNLVIASGGTTTLTPAASFHSLSVVNSLTINGTFVSSGYPVFYARTSLIMGDNSAITFANVFDLNGVSTFTRGTNTTITAGTFRLRRACVLAAGTYNVDKVWVYGFDTGTVVTPAAGSTTITGDLQLYTYYGDSNLNLAANAPTVTIQGDLSISIPNAYGISITAGGVIILEGDLIDEIVGAGAFTADSQDLTLSGTNSQSVALCAATWGAIVVKDKPTGTVTVGDDWIAASLDVQDGDVDFNEKDLTFSGAADFASGSTLVDATGATVACDTISFDSQSVTGLTINASTSGTATGTTFANTTFNGPGGAKLDASDGTCTDGGGNSGIDFGGAVVPPHLFQIGAA